MTLHHTIAELSAVMSVSYLSATITTTFPCLIQQQADFFGCFGSCSMIEPAHEGSDTFSYLPSCHVNL
jgi:hypothetical protein